MFRWIALVAFVGCMAVSAYYRRRAHVEGGRISRRAERPSLIVARVLFGLPLFLSILAYLVRPGWMAWSSVGLPTWLRWVGVGLGTVSVPMALWVLRALGRNVSETVLTKERQELVTAGPYRWIRHPLYTTGLALFGGIGLMAANWFILLFATLALVAIRIVVIPLEERELVARFGDAYRHYMARTGALLPHRWRRSGSAAPRSDG